MEYTVMLPAAGSGRRMGAGENKLFLPLAGKPILARTLSVFQQDPDCAGIILAVRPDERDRIREMLADHGITKVTAMPDGGGERQDSVRACVRAFMDSGSADDAVVMVHDAARPFLSRRVIRELAETVREHGAAIAAVPSKDTVKQVADGVVEDTPDRSTVWLVQTPQAFRAGLLAEAEEKALSEGFLGTDESMLVERLGHPVRVVESTYDNLKMTTKVDLAIGEALLKRQEEME
ncbi:2-C-methyl-D-erythritol 4-phosphate cytidylyltransferase [Bhargavaea cecembensis DSE10]|uniref:2-C-methyl-D-erythritol 4-phosphate cytidylyltransferase n=1 Tax=Bhargavaea cecembensis DSE10 TaxID=1235279 RepID=M7NGJ7_9BACL|nr:2-C-methyl-D-erythritol 4-phosphate cytidylyltransferase [Bhargavaea cecembensis]EMR06357.1 2-C-methyl-D-erythritol 4-phosphate cytidylyltransferase [Bhargavaea cecembensis DSE10]